MNQITPSPLSARFRGYLPVVVDIETGGLNPQTDALLEIAAVLLDMDSEGNLYPTQTYHEHILPFSGSNLDPESLKLTGIDPYHPFRFAVSEHQALKQIFSPIRAAIKKHQCQRAILVGHNAWFDLAFLKAAILRNNIKRNPFHAFSSIDTVGLSALYFGQTVLAKAVEASGIYFEHNQAHTALYDATVTADLFCYIVNQHKETYLQMMNQK